MPFQFYEPIFSAHFLMKFIQTPSGVWFMIAAKINILKGVPTRKKTSFNTSFIFMRIKLQIKLYLIRFICDFLPNDLFMTFLIGMTGYYSTYLITVPELELSGYWAAKLSNLRNRASKNAVDLYGFVGKAFLKQKAVSNLCFKIHFDFRDPSSACGMLNFTTMDKISYTMLILCFIPCKESHRYFSSYQSGKSKSYSLLILKLFVLTSEMVFSIFEIPCDS
ncbi:hypothetical protein EGR_01365 [Echinococcus granulosus]|uniref:Uncharacterized protein n=1 Tax=Echinococcus granulosus TaxID=6210 RepID=W6UYM3_ECHGR|nr:hypothetical protein EGR_01365 [Echinococcus granulosus]EUB63742.1 hypothetical protein EGR_01365 [Echinococcus granulosus]